MRIYAVQNIGGPKRALQAEIAGKKIEIHALKSCRNRLAVLETWHRNLEVVDNYTPVNESKIISCAHFSFLFLTACFPALEMNPCSKECGVKRLNSLLIPILSMLMLEALAEALTGSQRGEMMRSMVGK